MAPVEVRDVAPLTPPKAPPILARVIAAPLAVIEFTGKVAPMAPETLTDPAPAARVKSLSPSTVLDRVILPPPVWVSSVVVPLSVIERKNEMLPLVAVILSASELLDVPFCVNPPDVLMAAPLDRVKAPPLFVIVTPPLPVVVTGFVWKVIVEAVVM